MVSRTAAIDYRYTSRSAIVPAGSGSRLDLATSGGSTPGGDVDNPYFFSGFPEYPAMFAKALLVVARVARTRFYVPPNMLAAVIRAADPVITSTPEGLRFESFSVCCGVYARLDVDATALDIAHVAVGVTNVDVNPPLRQGLAGLRPDEPLHLEVGHDQFRVGTLDGEIVEESVPLSTRWIKGFAETQMLLAGMSLRQELGALPAVRFIQTLPRTSSTQSVAWATRSGPSLRLASRPSSGAVCVAGPERLRVLEPLLRFGTALRAYGPEAGADSMPMASSWVLDLPGARLTIGLSPEKSRGFSGEGSLLTALATGTDDATLSLATTMLGYESRIEPRRLAGRLGLSASGLRPVLGALASSGLLGFDLETGAYFHRPLPMGRHELSDLHPRLRDAQELVAEGMVSRQADGSWSVRSSNAEYPVVLTGDDRCTCVWWTKFRGTRGPCKHVLAARTASAGSPARAGLS